MFLQVIASNCKLLTLRTNSSIWNLISNTLLFCVIISIFYQTQDRLRQITIALIVSQNWLPACGSFSTSNCNYIVQHINNKIAAITQITQIFCKNKKRFKI